MSRQSFSVNALNAERTAYRLLRLMKFPPRRQSLLLVGLVAALLPLSHAGAAVQGAAKAASIRVDARRVENRLSPLLYGQFVEFMYEGVKSGLHAELLRDRSFEEQPNATGLPRYWERYPDDRDDDYGLAFAWDNSTSYPPARKQLPGL